MSPLICMGILCILLVALYLYFSHTRVASPFDDYSVDGVGEAEPPKGKSAVIQASQGVNTDAGICSKPDSAKNVCRNYESCCEISTSANNCFCTSPLIKDCRTIYKECLADQYFSQETMDFIDPGNKGKVCKSILDSCCNSMDTDVPDDNMEQVRMHTAAYNAKKLCQIQGGTATLCKRMCAVNPNCQGSIYYLSLIHI